MRFVLGTLFLLLLSNGVGGQIANEIELARKLYAVFLSIPAHPEILRGTPARKQFEYIVRIESDSADGIDKVGVERRENKATLWLLTKEAEMSGRMALYTLQFQQGSAGWRVVKGELYINGPSSMPKNIVDQCTIKPSALR